MVILQVLVKCPRMPLGAFKPNPHPQLRIKLIPQDGLLKDMASRFSGRGIKSKERCMRPSGTNNDSGV